MRNTTTTPAAWLAAQGHPGYGEAFAAQVKTLVQVDGMTVRQAIEVAYRIGGTGR